MTLGVHSYNGADYLHYFGENAEAVMAWNAAKANQSRAKTMAGAKSSMRSRINDSMKILQSKTSMSTEEIASYLDGEMFKDIPSLSEQAISNGENVGVNLEAAQAALNNLQNNLNSLSNFADAMKNVVDVMYSDNTLRTVLDGYAAQLVLEAKNNNSIMGRGGTKGNKNNKVANGLLRSILNQQEQKFFKVRENAPAEMDAALSKILVLIQTLPDVNVKTSQYRTSKQSLSQSQTLRGESQMLEKLYQKVYNFFQQSFKVIEEASLATGLQLAETHGLLKISEELSPQRMGDKSLNLNYKIDNRFKQEIEEGKQNLKRQTKRTGKSDVNYKFEGSVESGQGVVAAEAGFTVKDYKGLTFTGNEGVQTINGQITLQEGTSLLVALGREANLSTQERHNFAQLAVAHSYNGNEGSYDDTWNNMINYISERMFLNAVAGMKNSSESALFIVLNGKIFTISDLLNEFINNSDSYVKLAVNKGDVNGLTRSTYMDMSYNEWRGNRDVHNQFLAKIRSQHLYTNVLRKWASTKLQISLNMIDFKNMAQKNF